MNYTKEQIDAWIKEAGLSECIGVYNSAIEIDFHYLPDDLPQIEGDTDYFDDGYRVLAQLLDTAFYLCGRA